MTEAPPFAHPPARRIVLELDPGSDPISGSLDDGFGIRRFTGWLELADALQHAIAVPSKERPTAGRSSHADGRDER